MVDLSFFFFSSRRRHTRLQGDWSSDVCSSDLIAQRTAIGLTGDDLTVADVWSVAVERAPAELSDEAREKMRAARAIVEQAAHGTREHTYGVNTGFGRFVSRSIPQGLTGELQLRLL